MNKSVVHSKTPSINTVISFIKDIFSQTKKTHAVIAVSGGIDSAVALTLLTKALGVHSVTPVLLPYGDQDMTDAKTICYWNGFKDSSIKEIQIQPMVHQIAAPVGAISSPKRLGNIMARTRMILVFDTAANMDGLVCGTENKSEHHLGYFTRFGDAASDFEPLAQLYKTQVRAVASALSLPPIFLDKSPSAGLWDLQTDENELGFSYADADVVLEAYIDHHIPAAEIQIAGIEKETIFNICHRVDAMQFKQTVPYLPRDPQ